ALALLHPHCATATALPRGDYPAGGAAAPAGDRAIRWRQPLAGWPQLAVPAGGLPLRAIAPTGGRPLQGAWPQSVAPAGGLAVASHLCMQTACMWPPFLRRQHLLLLQQARKIVLRDSITS
ncbi:hypothetical protein BHM03_00017442, partial [Ensete ventricosum]